MLKRRLAHVGHGFAVIVQGSGQKGAKWKGTGWAGENGREWAKEEIEKKRREKKEAGNKKRVRKTYPMGKTAYKN